jgi:hypothetical protein
MQPYANHGGDSAVAAYEVGPDFIRVQFAAGATYLYTYASCGQHNCETMKSLAAQGHGLNAFINSVVRKGYARKEH